MSADGCPIACPWWGGMTCTCKPHAAPTVTLTIEECVYYIAVAHLVAREMADDVNAVHWRTVNQLGWAHDALVYRDVDDVRERGAEMLRRAREGRHNNPSVRASLFGWWLCRQALAAIRR